MKKMVIIGQIRILTLLPGIDIRIGGNSRGSGGFWYGFSVIIGRSRSVALGKETILDFRNLRRYWCCGL